MKKIKIPYAARVWIYRISGPLSLLLIGYGVIDDVKAALWLAFLPVALGFGTATTYTPKVSGNGSDIVTVMQADGGILAVPDDSYAEVRLTANHPPV